MFEGKKSDKKQSVKRVKIGKKKEEEEKETNLRKNNLILNLCLTNIRSLQRLPSLQLSLLISLAISFLLLLC